MNRNRLASSFRLSCCGAALALGIPLLLCGTPIASSGQGPDPSQEVIEHVHGVVVNAIDRQPVGRVLVTSTDQRMATMTDAEGRFGFDFRRTARASASGGDVFGSPGGRGGGAGTQTMTIVLMARRPGFLPLQLPVRLSLAVPSAGEGEVQLKMVPEGVIRGSLSASNGEVPMGVQVEILRKTVQDGTAVWAMTGSAQANSRGEYRFAELQAGEYKIMTQVWTEPGFRPSRSSPAPEESSGYPPAYNGDGRDLATTPAIQVGAGETAEADLSLRASTFYRVGIPVTNVAQGAGFGVVVGSEDGMSGLSLMFNSQTQEIEGILPNGAYDVHVSSFGQTQSSGTGRVEVAGKPVTAAAISLTPNGTIQVIVRQEYTAIQPEATGRAAGLPPVPEGPGRSLDVSLRPVGMAGQVANLGGSTPRNGDEGLALGNVREGAYRVLATAYRGYIASLTSDGVDLLRQPLVVGPGGASAPIEVTIRDDGATLSGAVSVGSATEAQASFDGEAIWLTCIPLGNDSGRLAQGIATRDDKFTIPNLAPGQYLVLASRTPMQDLEYRNEQVLGEAESKGTVVTLTAGQKSEIQVPLLSEEEN